MCADWLVYCHQQSNHLRAIERSAMINYYAIYPSKCEFWKDTMMLVLYGMTTVTSLFGNTVVCYVAFRLRSHSKTYTLLGNMAISDLVSALVIPSQWLFCSTAMLNRSERVCSVFKSLQVISYFISTFTMALIAIDRYMILRNPLARRLRVQASIVSIWVLSAVLAIPTQFTMRVPEYFSPNRLQSCRIILKTSLFPPRTVRRFRVTTILLAQYLIPSIIAAIFYALCISKILARKRLGENTDEQEHRFYRSKMRTIKMMLISLLAFTLGWLPVHLVHLLDFYLVPLLPKECNSSFSYNLVYWLSISSCCFNPFIYCWFDPKFRRASKRCLSCLSWVCGRHQPHQQSDVEDSSVIPSVPHCRHTALIM